LEANTIDTALTHLLAAADRRTLAAVVVHLSQDPNAVPDLADRPAIEARAAEVLPPFMRGDEIPAVPDDDLLQASMDLAVGQPVPPEYRAYVREQTGIGPNVSPAPIEPPSDFNVLVIGAGASGIAVARTLEQRGLTDFTMVDAHPSPGGAWWANTYPGCRVDTPSLLYSFSFDQDPGWPEHFSPQPALLSYLRGVAQDSGLTSKLRTETRVVSLTWSERLVAWEVGLVDAEGRSSTTTAEAVIAAPGLLTVPKIPDIPGRDTFAGPSWHSARWDHDVDIRGKRVAVVGTGASAQQIVPAIASIAGEVLVYQRSPQWLMAHEKYGRALSGVERELFERIPMYREWNRFSEGWRFGDGTTPFVLVDPEWTDPRSINEHNERLRRYLEAYIHEKVGHRPDLLSRVVPDYPPFTKRMLIDNGWFDALLRDNVHLRTTGIEGIDPEGIRTADGLDDVDVIVYATGFQADRFLSGTRVTGRGGADVSASLEADPQAYLGLALEDCPNFFLTPGPNAYLGHAGNGMFFAEIHARYITECMREMFARGAQSMTARPEAVRAYARASREQLESTVWNRPGVDSWFKGERDHIVTIAAKSVIEFWNEYREVDVDAYDFDPAG
jgi:4-hydroxyacetophenone monooxygenase